jgi:hypothetical protein
VPINVPFYIDSYGEGEDEDFSSPHYTIAYSLVVDRKETSSMNAVLSASISILCAITY